MPAKRSWSVPAVAALVLLPLFVYSAWLYRNGNWAPIFDIAITEVRVRDVGTAHTPLVGLPGRLGKDGSGSHPGPWSFYLLAPVHRLLGGSYWALQVSTAALNALAIISSLWIARRRGGVPAVIAAGLGIALLEMGYGLLVLTEPWNPYLPVFWFVVFLLAVWSVVCGDLKLLPVAAGSASVCAQTHIPYLAVCGGIAFSVVLWVLVSWQRARSQGLPAREHVRSLLAALAVVVVLWAPPVVEQLFHEPGNFKILFDYFANPPAATVGFAGASKAVLRHLDGWHVVVGSLLDPRLLPDMWHARQPASGRGGVLLALWVIGVIITAKLENRSLLALHGVVAASLVVELIAVSRIIGVPWAYLMLWGWAISVLTLIATASSLALGAWSRVPERLRARPARLAVLGAALIGSCSVRLALDVKATALSVPNTEVQLADLAPDAAAAILEGAGAASGLEGRYLVDWWDAVHGGAQGVGLANELERRRLQVGVAAVYGQLMTQHRVMKPEQATARVLLANGGWIDEARKIPGAVQVAFSDRRSAEARREYEALRIGVLLALLELGLKDAASQFDRNMGVINTSGVSVYVHMAVNRMGQLGVPAAVFIVPMQPR